MDRRDDQTRILKRERINIMALHLTVKFGDFFEIKHGDDRAVISVHKRANGQARISIEATNSFRCRTRKRAEEDETKAKPKVKCGAI